MARKLNTMFSRMVRIVAAIATITLGGTASQAQQIWQAVYGHSQLNDAARGGVVTLPNNTGIVFAGQARGNADDDIYVVETNGCYTAVWGFLYNIGGNDVARKIRQTADGGFIVVGTTENGNACGTHNDIFLLKIDANGAVQWTRTYGGPDLEEGRDVQVIAGGYIVGGYTQSYGQGNYDALLMRTDLLGNPIWTRTYGGADDDYFMGCSIAANGDILAAGGTESFTPANDADIFLLRANVVTGLPVVGFPYHYGGNQYELAWHVIECANGDLVTCGNTLSFGGNSEALLMRTTNAGVFACGRTYGGANGLGWDDILDIQEVEGGNFITTGLFYNVPNGWGNYDMYTSQVGPCFLPISETIHGGPGDDQGWAVTRVNGAPEYALVGLTTSYGFGGEDVYVVRQQGNGTSGCLDRTPGTVNVARVLVRQGTTAVSAALNIPNCQVVPGRLFDDSWLLLCSSCIQSPLHAPAQHHLTNDGIVPEDGRVFENIDSASAVASVSADAVETGLSAYPNPVRSGESFTMLYPSAGKGNALVTVSDLSGTVVGRTEKGSTGGEITIGTDGWAAGVYIVQVREGGRAYTRRVVVVER